MNEREIFFAVLEKGTAKERLEFLSTACGTDFALRKRIDDLLHMHEKTGEFLQKPLVERLAEGVAALEKAVDTDRDLNTRPNSTHDLGFLTPSDQTGSLGRLGYYEVQEVIGRGGMGIVLRAFDQKLHRVVAIKVMAAPLATSAAARKRFLREARAAAALDHERIVTIHHRHARQTRLRHAIHHDAQWLIRECCNRGCLDRLAQRDVTLDYLLKVFSSNNSRKSAVVVDHGIEMLNP